MKVYSNRFGRLEVTEEALVTFPSGLVGFPSHRRFVVLDVEGTSDYQWLQCVDEPSLAFVLMDMEVLAADVQVEIPDDSLRELEIEGTDSLLLLAVVTIPTDVPERASANLRAPLVVNLRTRKGKQLILHESIPIRYPLIPEQAQSSADPVLTTEPASVSGG